MENPIQPQNYERLSVQEMKKEVLSHFNFEKGIAFTFWMMLKNPKQLISIYLNEDRKKVFNPFRFLLIGVAVSTIILINHPAFKAFIDSLYAQNIGSFRSLEEKLHMPLWENFLVAQELYMSYQNVLIIISLPVVSWVTWRFFIKTHYNYAEHLVINAFVFGTTYWLSSITALLTFFSKASMVATYMMTVITFVLATILYKRIFGKGILKSLLGIFLAYIPIYLIGILSQFVILLILLALL